MKRSIFFLFFILGLGINFLAAQNNLRKITRIALFDFNKIYQELIINDLESPTGRRYQDLNYELIRLEENFLREKNQVEEEIQELTLAEQERRMYFTNRINFLRRKQTQLESAYMRNKTRVEAEVKKLVENIDYSNVEFYQKVLEEVEFVARNEGFSLVLDINKLPLFFYENELDITDLVFARLKRK